MDVSLKSKAEEAGISFDALMEQLRLNRSDEEIAEVLAASPGTIKHLREHFERFGIHSIAGQD